VKVKINRECDAVYFRLTDGEIVVSEETEHGFIVDYDSNNKLVGIEILGVSQFVPGESLNCVNVDYSAAM
jgi:uncharacterized protein YuzE